MLGMRPGELIGLRWDDVDLDTDRLAVCGAMKRGRGTLHRADPKTAKSRHPLKPAVDTHVAPMERLFGAR